MESTQKYRTVCMQHVPMCKAIRCTRIGTCFRQGARVSSEHGLGQFVIVSTVVPMCDGKRIGYFGPAFSLTPALKINYTVRPSA